MSLDRSLKSGDSLTKHRNVLTRPERIARLAENERFDPESGDPLGLPKVANRQAAARKKPKKAGAEGEVEGEGEGLAEPGAGAEA